MQEIRTPTILLDWGKAANNLQRMLDKAAQNQLVLRPHFKTPQSIAIGQRFRTMGVRAITVSSLSMASYFAEDGWNDISVAFPINTREIGTIYRLSRTIQLNLMVANSESLDFLMHTFPGKVGIFIKIDVGTNRTGLAPENTAAIQLSLKKIQDSPSLFFKGFMAHAGHSYRKRSKADIMEVHESSIAILQTLKDQYISQYPNLLLSTGDTPTCSTAKKWPGIDEIRPGNFIFYDLMQVQITSCKMKDIAVALACPVVAKHAKRKEVVIYGGGIHLSKDRLEWNGQTIYGRPVVLTENGWNMPDRSSYVRSVSQEHGVIKCSTKLFSEIKVGGLIGILPVHSCMMVDCMDGFLTTTGEYLSKMDT